MTVPAIKGTGFQSAVDDIQRLLDTDRLTREELEARLEPDDVILLESKVGPATWVPMDTYRRVIDVLIAIEGRGDAEGYLVQRGWRAAERLHKAGLYSQFDATMDKWGMRVGKLVVTLGPVMYNFTKWAFESQPEAPGNFTLTVSEAEHFPDCARYTAQGFVEYLARSIIGRTVHVTSERMPEGRILYTGHVA
jgi:hypothetical protein